MSDASRDASPGATDTPTTARYRASCACGATSRTTATRMEAVDWMASHGATCCRAAGGDGVEIERVDGHGRPGGAHDG